MDVRIAILGNAGAGKTTLARRLARQHGVAMLSLDTVAFARGAERRPLAETLAEIDAFVGRHAGWVVEGCYADLVAAVLPRCTELVFLNPGVDACLERCRARAWEPDKFATREEQDAVLPDLLAWVAAYATRDDEFGLRRHRALFDAFAGPKRESR